MQKINKRYRFFLRFFAYFDVAPFGGWVTAIKQNNNNKKSSHLSSITSEEAYENEMARDARLDWTGE